MPYEAKGARGGEVYAGKIRNVEGVTKPPIFNLPAQKPTEVPTRAEFEEFKAAVADQARDIRDETSRRVNGAHDRINHTEERVGRAHDDLNRLDGSIVRSEARLERLEKIVGDHDTSALDVRVGVVERKTDSIRAAAEVARHTYLIALRVLLGLQRGDAQPYDARTEKVQLEHILAEIDNAHAGRHISEAEYEELHEMVTLVAGLIAGIKPPPGVGPLDALTPPGGSTAAAASDERQIEPVVAATPADVKQAGEATTPTPVSVPTVSRTASASAAGRTAAGAKGIATAHGGPKS